MADRLQDVEIKADIANPTQNVALEDPFIVQFDEALEQRAKAIILQLLESVHPADAADMFEQREAAVFEQTLQLLDKAFPADIWREINPLLRQSGLAFLSHEAIILALKTLSSDDAAELLEHLEDTRRSTVLSMLEQSDRQGLEEQLDYETETAGRLMQRDYVVLPEIWTVGEAVDYIRQVGNELPDDFHEIYVVDAAHRLVGVLSLSALLRHSRNATVRELMTEPLLIIRPDIDQEDVAYAFQQYNLISAPVLNDLERIEGVITIDDIVDVIQNESREDMLALSGVNDATINDGVFDIVKARAPWLGINVLTAFLAAMVVSQFEQTIAAYVALAIMLPVIAGLGGNAGSQALAVTVRALAERDLTRENVARAIGKETLAGLVNGLIFASLIALIAQIWFGSFALAQLIWIAMLCTFIWAGFCGVFIPVSLQRLGVDPAVASSVFVLTLIDVAGFFVFLGLAALILQFPA